MTEKESEQLSTVFQESFDESRMDASRRNMKIMIVIVFAAIFAGSLIKVDVYAFAAGRISPEDYLKSIDAPRAGKINAVLVKDGENVKVGDPILEYDCTPLEARAVAGAAQLAHFEKELSTRSQLVGAIAPDYVQPTDTPNVSQEADLRAEIYRGEISDAREGAAQAAARIRSARAQLESAKSEVVLAKNRYDRVSGLHNRGFASNAALDEAQSALRTAEARVTEVEASVAESLAARDQARLRASQIASAGKLEAIADYSFVRSRVLELQSELAELQAEMKDCKLSAPDDGTFFWLSPIAKGTWLRSATPLAKVVQSGDKMVVEAQLRNQDIPFVKVGQTAIVKLDSLPFERYGSLLGEVKFVANDSTENELGESSYKIRVEITHIPEDARLRLPEFISGMDVKVNVVTDQRRLISYFLDPIILAVRESFHER